MRFIKTFLFLAILVGMVLFFLQNSAQLEQEVIFNFKLYIGDYGWSTPPLPFFFIILIAFALGGFLAIIALGVDRLRLSGKIRRNNRKIRMLEKELRTLRELPLAPVARHDATQQLPAADK